MKTVTLHLAALLTLAMALTSAMTTAPGPQIYLAPVPATGNTDQNDPLIILTPQDSDETDDGLEVQPAGSATQYVGGLLNVIGGAGTAPDTATTDPQAQQETGEYVEDVLNKLIDIIYGPRNTTTPSPDGNAQASEEDDNDDDDDDGGVPVTVGTTTASPVDDDDDSSEEVVETTTTAPATPPSVTSTTTTTTSTTTTTTTTVRPTTTSTTLAATDESIAVTSTFPTPTTDESIAVTSTFPTPTTEDDSSSSEEEIDSTTTVVPGLCDGCDFKHGVGFNPHPSDCTLFVRCQLNDKGLPVVSGVQSCPHGMYWNQAKLTCDFQKNVQCLDDICRGSKPMKLSAASCRGYWNCSSGSAVAKCCAPGFAFNPVTSLCQYKPSCQDECLSSATRTNFECNGMRGVPGDRNKYEVKTGSTWTRMSCHPSLAFSTKPCGCTVRISEVEQPKVCAPELYLPFDKDYRDYSGHNNWVLNEGVLVKDGKAFFDGNSRLVINRFSSAWWGSTVFIQLRYKTLAGGVRQALVSNGDCQVRPSLAICTGPKGVDFYAETENSAMPANFTVSDGYFGATGWQDVLYRLDANNLHGYLNIGTSSATAKGVLETRERGLVIGSGGGCEDFEGFIDEITVYLCQPRIQN